MAPDVARRIAAKTRAQTGAIARRQAIACGLSPSTIDRLIQQRVWIVLQRGVYAIASSADTWHRRVFAALLAAGDGAVLAGTAAAFEWGLIDRAPAVIDVAVPERRRVQLTAARTRCLNLHRMDTTYKGRVPILSIARTIVELAGSCDDTTLEDITVEAIRRWPNSLRQLSE